VAHVSDEFPDYHGGNLVELHHPDLRSLSDWEALHVRVLPDRRQYVFVVPPGIPSDSFVSAAKRRGYRATHFLYMVRTVNASVASSDRMQTIAVAPTDVAGPDFASFYRAQLVSYLDNSEVIEQLLKRAIEAGVRGRVQWLLARGADAPEPVGGLGVFSCGSLLRLQDVYVRAAYRNLGVGSALLDSVSITPSRRGSRALVACVLRDSRAVKWYRRHGFRDVGALVEVSRPTA